MIKDIILASTNPDTAIPILLSEFAAWAATQEPAIPVDLSLWRFSKWNGDGGVKRSLPNANGQAAPTLPEEYQLHYGPADQVDALAQYMIDETPGGWPKTEQQDDKTLNFARVTVAGGLVKGVWSEDLRAYCVAQGTPFHVRQGQDPTYGGSNFTTVLSPP